MDDENLYASPEADVDVDVNDELAGRGARLLGALLDGFFMTLIILPTMLFTGYIERASSGDVGIAELAFWAIFGVIVWVVLNAYLLKNTGQTIGKRIVGTRIVSNADGKILTFTQVLFLRFLPFTLGGQVPVVGPLAGIINILFIFSSTRRCLHDHIAGTKVVKA
ncbi:MAG: RDD family protein [Pseudomonadota bacterium]